MEESNFALLFVLSFQSRMNKKYIYEYTERENRLLIRFHFSTPFAKLNNLYHFHWRSAEMQMEPIQKCRVCERIGWPCFLRDHHISPATLFGAMMV